MEFRKRKRLVVGMVVTSVVAFVSCLLLLGNPAPEPLYQGRPLSAWIADLNCRHAVHGCDIEKDNRATEAIRAIGTNALPCFLRWMSFNPRGLRFRLSNLLEKLPYSIRHKLPYGDYSYQTYVRYFHTDDALELLGPAAAPAIPELTRMAHLTDGPQTRTFALLALTHIGPAAMPAILGVVSNFSQPSDVWMLYPLQRVDEETAVQIEPFLMPFLQSPNLGVATNVLEWFSSVPVGNTNAMLASYLNCLNDPRPEVRAPAALWLRDLGTNAHSALPRLIQLLDDSNAEVRERAVWAIPWICNSPTDALPALLKGLSDSEEDIRAYAAQGLGYLQKRSGFNQPQLSSEMELARSFLVRALDDPEDLVRVYAAEALGKFGRAGAPALPALANFLNSSNAALRQAATKAVASINGESSE